MSIVVVGMLDEREEALGTIKSQIEQRGHKALLIDISIGTGAIVPSLRSWRSGRLLGTELKTAADRSYPFRLGHSNQRPPRGGFDLHITQIAGKQKEG